MDIKNVWAIYFSPTGTTEKAALALADKLAKLLGVDFKKYDFTLPSARRGFAAIDSDDLVVFATPTYAGRVPNVLLKYLATISVNGALAVPLVTFGNRNFDNSLIELRDILENGGFKTIGAAALACEHSFSYELGKGRPDDDDLKELDNFAKSVISSLKSDTYTSPVEVRGISSSHTPPYGGYYQPQDRNGAHIDIRKVTPKVAGGCTNCGICADVCPMGSIVHDDITKMQGICIKCCACYKKCPTGARYFDDEGYLYHKSELEDVYGRRASNSFFL